MFSSLFIEINKPLNSSLPCMVSSAVATCSHSVSILNDCREKCPGTKQKGLDSNKWRLIICHYKKQEIFFDRPPALNNRQRIGVSQLPNQGKARVRNDATFLFTSDHLKNIITKLISRLSGNRASRWSHVGEYLSVIHFGKFLGTITVRCVNLVGLDSRLTFYVLSKLIERLALHEI